MFNTLHHLHLQIIRPHLLDQLLLPLVPQVLVPALLPLPFAPQLKLINKKLIKFTKNQNYLLPTAT